MSFFTPARVRIALALLLLTIGFAPAASAATATFQILLDLDNSQATGCNVPALTGTFKGVDQILISTVTTSSGVAQVTALQVRTCTAAPNTFSAPVAVAAPAGHPLPWPVGISNGASGASVIETYYPLSLSPVGNPLIVRLGVLGFDSSGALTDEMLTTQTAGGFPILLQAASIAEVPTLTEWGLILLSLVLAFAAVAVLRRRRTAGTVLLALLLLGAAGVAWAAAGACDLDGTTTGEWSSTNLLATDSSDATAGADMRAFYGFKDAPAGALCFRIDANLEFTTPQTITFTSTAPAGATVSGPTYNVTATASSGLPVTLSIDPSATAVCSLSGSTVSFLSVGTCVIDANQAGDSNFDPAPQAQQSFAVGKGAQTLSFTSTAPASATVGGPTYTVTATASPSGLPAAFTIDPSATAVCSLSGSTVSFLSVGTCVVDADQAGDANYNAAPQVQQSFAVGKGAQTLSFTSTAPAAATVGGATYMVTATASPSGLPVAFTIDASATAVCSIAGSTVSFTGVGTCVIDANQPGDANYNAAPQVQQSFTVGKGTQTISFTSTAPAAAAVGGATYTVTATASPSGLPVAFTIDASATAVCSLAGSTVSFIGVGTCVIDADQPGDANYNPAAQVQQSFTVGKGTQTISFTSTAPAAATVGGATYTVTATASPSGLPVTFTIDASATAVCSLSGSTVSFIGVGSCVIDANQAGDANYNAAAQVQQSFTVGKGSQTISFTSTAPAAATVGGATYTVTATASPSGLPVTFTIDASATAVCSLSGSTVSFLSVGTCVIDANQPGNTNYNAAPQVQQSFAVAKGNQTISFTSTAPVAASVGGATYTVTATASPSSLPVTFTIDATASTVCSISGSTVSFIGVGTCVIDANQPGNANYNAAPQVQQSFAVGKGTQTISFTSTAPAAAAVGGATYTVTATASPSGLPVTFTIDASATAVCSIAGSTVSFTGVGTCVIDANQPGNANYNAAPQVQQSFAVVKGNQTISFTSTAPAAAKVGGATYTVTATASPSGLPVTFTIDATATSVCSIAGSTVSFTGVGTCVIDANQPGNASYNAAPQVQQSFAVAKGNQTISFTSTAPAGATVSGPTYTVTATASPSALPVTFTIDAVATSVCSISGSTVSFIGVGTCVIDANQAGNASYNAAPQVQQSFAVGKGSQTISFTSTAPVGATVNGPTYTVTATATSGLAVTFTIDASATSVCSISGSTVSFIGAGTCVIDANQPGNANFNAAPQVQQSFAVAKGSQTISFTSTAPAAAVVSGSTYTVTATATSGLAVAFTIDASATSVCSISGSTVSFIGVGTCVIDANQAGNAAFNAAPQVQQSFAVGKGSQTISYTSTAPGGAVVGGPTYTVTATATSGLAVTFTIDASAAAVCSISGSTVSFIGAGTCVIDANQAGNANFNAAPQAQQSFAVGKGSQTISYTSTAPVGATVGGATYTVTATATSGLAVVFTIDASATSVCSISGSTVSFIGAGTCVIDANQPGNANFNAAPQVQQSFSVAKGNQTISFTSTAPSNASVGGPTYTVTATATSGLAVVFTSATASVCTVSGSTVSFVGPGTCTINANQPGNANYNAAPQMQQSFSVFQAPQITSANATSFTSTQPGTFTVTTTGNPTGASMVISESGALPSGVTFVNNNNGTATLAGTPAAGTQGTYSIVITANNGIAPNATQNFTLTVLNLVPQPIASPKETFDTVGNVQFEFKAAKTLSPGIFVSGNLVANFTDPDGPSPLSAVAFNGATTNGGQVTIATNGEFTFTPKAGDLAASDSFSYQITDGLATVTRTVTINLKSRAWFVKNNAAAGGTGRSHEPFNTLVAAQTASLAGDYIFVYGGSLTNTGQAAGFVLKANQKLYGEAFGLTIANTINGVANPTLVTANTANRPVIDNSTASSDGISATNISGVEVRGISVSGTQDAIDLTTNGGNSGGITATDNVIRLPGIDGIHVAAGGTGAVTLAISNNSITGNVRGMNLLKTAGTMTITDFSNNVVTSATPGSGIVVDGAIFDATAGNPITTVSGGTTSIGQSGTPVGAVGVSLTNVTGDLAFTDLDIYNNAGAGLRVTSTGALNAAAGTGFRITVGSGVGTIDSNGGPAIDISGSSVNLPLLTFLRSTNSTTTGVSLVNAFGGAGGTTLSAASGQVADPVGASGNAFVVDGGNGNVSFGGPIFSSSGNAVVVTNRTSDTVAFSGAITETGSGISLTSNTGATISFTGTVAATTGANAAFTATGGGTVTTTDTASTLTTTTGTALNVTNTTIGAGGLKFKSITAGTAASGPTNGIVLNNTGTSGGLTVAGTGSAGTGGTIQKTGAEGILLNSSANASFSWMSIQNPGTHGISSTGVNNLTVANTTVTDAAGSNTTDDGFHIINMLGTLNITSCSINGARHQGVTIDNNNTNMAALSMTGTTVTNTPGGDGMLMQMRGTSVLTTATISGNTFSSNFSTGLQVANQDTANIASLTVQSNTVTSNNAGMDFDLSQSSNMTVNVLTNTFNSQKSVSLNVFSATAATAGTMTAKLQGNLIGTAGVLDSGGGTGIRVITQNAKSGLYTIDSNTIREVPNGFGIDVEAIGHTAGSNVKVKITGNTVSRPTGTNINIGCGTLAPCPESSIFVSSDTDSAAESVCTVISGNTAYDPTSWPQGAGFAAYYLARRGPTPQVLNLEGNTAQNARTNILANNTVTNFTSGDFIDELGNVTVVAAGTCGGSFP